MTKILITSTSFAKNDKSPLELLQSRGYTIVWNESGKPLAADALVEKLAGCEGVIAGLDYFSAEVFQRVNGLRVVARYGVGVDRVDLDAAKAAGVVVTNTPTANSDSVADLAVGLMLAVARHIVEGHNQATSGEWPKLFGVSLLSKVVGLVGLGRIGARVAARLRGFGCEIIVYDPFVGEAVAERSGCRKVATLQELLAAADFVSLHLPATSETNNIIDAAALSQMKPTAILVNTSRGELIDDDALVAALTSRKLLGAGLDAHSVEPLPKGKYIGVPNLVITPHIGAYTSEALHLMASESAADLIAVIEGRPPQYRVV